MLQKADLPVHFGMYAATELCRLRCGTCQVWLAVPGDKPSGAHVQCQLVEDSIGTSHQTRRCIQITSSEEHTFLSSLTPEYLLFIAF